MKMINYIKNNYKVLTVFFLFFIFILLLNHFLFLFHDDYGYASLSYFSNYNGIKGPNYNLIDMLSFLSYHYFKWGGRVLYFFFEILLLRFGLSYYRFFQAIITVGIFYVIYKIIVKKTNIDNFKVALFCVLCFGLFEVMNLRSGYMWITASILYFIPLFPFLLFVYFYDGKTKIGLCSFLIFMSTWSHEQISILALSYILCYTLYDWFILKNKNKKHLIVSLVALIGFLILMMAPGSYIRVNSSQDFYSLSIIDKMRINIPEILFNNFGKYTKLFSIFFFISMLYVIIQNKVFKFLKKFNKYIRLLSILSTLVIVILIFIKPEGYFYYFYNIKNSNVWHDLMDIIFIIQLLLIFYNLIIYFYGKNNIEFIYIIIGAFLSQLAMVVAPYFPLRSTTMFNIMFFAIITYLYVQLMKKSKFCSYIVLIILAIYSLSNSYKILHGYYTNNDENIYNDSILKETSKRIKNGEKIDKVKLKKLQDLVYGTDVPYLEGLDYIYEYIKYYYELPQDLEIVYDGE